MMGLCRSKEILSLMSFVLILKHHDFAYSMTKLEFVKSILIFSLEMFLKKKYLVVSVFSGRDIWFWVY